MMRCYRCRAELDDATGEIVAGVGPRCANRATCKDRQQRPVDAPYPFGDKAAAAPLMSGSPRTGEARNWDVSPKCFYVRGGASGCQPGRSPCTECRLWNWGDAPRTSEAELDSPPFRPAAADELAKRGYERVNGWECPNEASPSDGFDPEHCATCREFADRNRPPPKVELKCELWDSAKLKMRQLESEIQASSATRAQKSNMLHSFSKLTMFASDAWERAMRRAARAQRSEPARLTPEDWKDIANGRDVELDSPSFESPGLAVLVKNDFERVNDPRRARLDPDGTAKPKTRLVNTRQGRGESETTIAIVEGPADTYVADDGTRIPLTEPRRESVAPCGRFHVNAEEWDELQAELAKLRKALRDIANGDGANEQAHDWPEFYASVKRQAQRALDADEPADSVSTVQPSSLDRLRRAIGLRDGEHTPDSLVLLAAEMVASDRSEIEEGIRPASVSVAQRVCGDVEPGEAMVVCSCGLLRAASRTHGYTAPPTGSIAELAPNEEPYALPWCTHRPKHILIAACDDRPCPKCGGRQDHWDGCPEAPPKRSETKEGATDK